MVVIQIFDFRLNYLNFSIVVHIALTILQNLDQTVNIIFIQMQGNKICITRRGLQIIKDQRDQLPLINNPQNQSKQILTEQKLPSLSLSSSYMTSNAYLGTGVKFQKPEMYNKKYANDQHLSDLSLTLAKYKNKGIKRLMIDRQDKKLTEILKEESKNRQRYIQKLIPEIVRKTRDKNKINNLTNRYNRSKSYAERLLFNYHSQTNFGFSNTIRKKLENQQQSSKSKSKKK